jgi:hypothetical protein
VERGERLPTEPWLAVVPQASPRAAAVLGFPGFLVVAADVEPAWVHDLCPDGDLSAPLNPPFLHALERRLDRRVNSIDMVMLADPAPAPAGPAADPASASAGPAADPASASAGPAADPASASAGPASGLRAVDDADHPRVRRARRYRDDVRVWALDGGVLVIGRGLGGRWEAAVEVDQEHRNAGLGRRLAAAARALVPEPRPVWAQVAPGNAASVRAFLAAGYRPVGSEALLVP